MSGLSVREQTTSSARYRLRPLVQPELGKGNLDLVAQRVRRPGTIQAARRFRTVLTSLSTAAAATSDTITYQNLVAGPTAIRIRMTTAQAPRSRCWMPLPGTVRRHRR
jgi:hypothetical protein